MAETTGMGSQGGEGRDASGMPSRQELSRRFNLLLEKFPRADGVPWRASEIEEATAHEVTSSYFSALKSGKFKRPGIKQLTFISDVVGFPFELWYTEPELWDEVLQKSGARGGFRGGTGFDQRPDLPVPRVPSGEELAALVESLFNNKKSPSTGKPYDEEGVAARSRGRITAEEIRAMRSGRQEEPPAEIKLIALSDVFDVPPHYWYAPAGEERPVVDLDALARMVEDGHVLIRHRQHELSQAERNMVSMLFKYLETGREEGETGGDKPG